MRGSFVARNYMVSLHGTERLRDRAGIGVTSFQVPYFFRGDQSVLEMTRSDMAAIRIIESVVKLHSEAARGKSLYSTLCKPS